MLPRLTIANLPTPLERMPRLTEALGGPTLLVKRDDLTGLAFGGNKTRKLEFLLADAQAHAARTLITAGAPQSNHCRQTAAAAARFGFACILVLTGEPVRQATANHLLDLLFGAEIVWTGREERARVLEATFQQAQKKGREPYLIPYGGSNPVGAAAYAMAMKELMEQWNTFEGRMEIENRKIIDWIVFASSSGGTQAGLSLGARMVGFQGKVLGISVDEPQDVLQARVADLSSATARFLGQRWTFQAAEILVDAGYCTPGYGVLTGSEKKAIHLFARTEGLLLDPVYTGRAAAGLLDLIRKKFFKKEENVLFWHTGGQPALFAGQYQPGLL